MLSRSTKAAFYSLAGPFMRLNGGWHRRFFSPAGTVRVQLGPGQKNYLQGWINVDANKFTGKCDIWANLADGIPLPDASVDALYSHHVIEHLPDLQGHWREVSRVLKPGGVFRIGGPNGDAALRMYLDGRAEWFSDFPDNRRSIGGRLENFIFCRGEHLTILTPSYLEELAGDAGLTDLRVVKPVTETGYPALFDAKVMELEWESTSEMPHTLILEGAKPLQHA